jgi:amino acid adenylation domain-containing protein/non-ribosomal peptide synthase protein (TIGR01720 family)
MVELLRTRAGEHPQRQAYLFLADGEREEASLTYGELDREARAIAAALQAEGAAGERVLLLYPPGLQYISALLGCMYAGAIAVPAYPPRRHRGLARLQAIFADAGATLALTTDSLLPEIRPRIEQLADLVQPRWLATRPGEDAGAGDWRQPAIDGETLAFLQYTSGSTAAPKGVMVSHANLLYNQRMIQQAYDHSAATVFVGWLPLYHDMGLIGNVLQPLFLGVRSVLMSPAAFLQQPRRWLAAISRYRATTSGGPDFAYRLCVERIPPAARAELDLASWSVAFNGAEPVRAETVEDFAAAFAGCGFRRAAFCPCYGLAEATLLAAGGPRAAPPAIYTACGRSLGQGQVTAAAAGDPDARRLVGCGGTLLEQQIVIADPQRLTRCAPDRVGEIWLAGPNIARGYWGRGADTALTFAARLAGTGEGPFLRTGDLGFLADGELFVTGRAKDLIILRGVNHYPQDLEHTAEQSHAALAPGASAAFSLDAAGEERLVLVLEPRRADRRVDVEEVARAVRQAISEEHEAAVHGVVLIQPGTIAKTSSGKVQRHANRAAFLAGSLVEIGRSVLDEGPAPPPAAAAASAGSGFVRRALLAVQSPPERRALLLLHLEEQAALALRLPAPGIEPGVPLSALGLDSLTAITLEHRLESSLGIALPPGSLLAGPTLDELATELLARLEAPETALPAPAPMAPMAPMTPMAPAGSPERASGSLGPQPLSYGQRALWYLYQSNPESPAYNIAFAVRLRGGLDVPALRRALAALLDRHPALRTTFGAPSDREPEAWVQERQELPLTEADLRGSPAAALAERLADAAHRPFDLERGPLLRLELCRRADDEHVLLLVAHHIVTDLWSLAILVSELGTLYGAHRRGRGEAGLPAPRLLYSDYVRWQAEMLAGPEGDRLWEYWRRQLDGPLPPLELPCDRPRSATRGCNGATRPQRLRAELGEDLKRLSRRHGTTLFMTLLAAYQTLLHRYTGAGQVLVGSPMPGRSRAELADVVGYFVNLVALRGDAGGDPPFAALLDRVRLAVQGAYAHQELPFALLVERLQPVRDPSRSPIFQVALAMQRTPLLDSAGAAALALGETGIPLVVGDLTLEPEPLAGPVVPFDLTLMLAEAGGPLLASWQYDRELFDAPTISRMAGHFATLLAAVARDPSQRLSELPLLGEHERHQLVTEDAAEPPAAAAVEESASLYRAVAEQAARTPDAVAASLEQEHLTYGELDRRAGRLARHLRSLGVGPEALVGVCLEPSLQLPEALLGIARAGGAYLPLDPEHPAERLRFMTADAGVRWVVTTERCGDRCAGTGARLVRLDADAAAIAGDGAAVPAAATLADQAAYVIYTSGSTGRPKGVVVAHRQVLRLFRATAAWFGFGASDTWTLFHSFSFDFSVWELWGALVHGGRVVIVPRWLSRAPEAFYALLLRERVTVLNQTPGAFYQLMRAEQALDSPAAALNLRWIVFGGEELAPRRLDSWFARHGDRRPRLVNMYGITETTVHVTWRPLDAGDAQRPGSPIGAPISDLRTYVVDASLRPVPLGLAGELVVGGAGLARGYLGQPALTATRFCPDPFGRSPGTRLYRSGDLVRRLPGGDLEYLGRIDQQVKVRGFRVELGEIEAALRRHPDVRDAAVTARAEPSGVRLAGYVVTGEHRVPVEELRRHLRETLPDYMVPAVFVSLEALPLSHNGKVDRRALPEPDRLRPELAEARIAPRDHVEAQLAEIWCAVLGVEEVGVTDNFFALGGDSILSLLVVTCARQLGYRLTPRQTFDHQTIAELAAAARRQGGATEPPAAAAPAAGVAAPEAYRLTPMQQGLLFHTVFEPDRDEYLVQVLCHLDGPLDAAAFAGAWRLAGERHPVLRTSFHWQGLDEPVQRVEAAAEPAWRHDDWRALTGAEQQRRLDALLAADRRRGFDLTAAPLLRLELLRLGDERRLLVVTSHHLILDGWSAAALLGEVLTSYAALHAGRSPALPAAPPFADYLTWLAGQDQTAAEAWWRLRLRGFTAPTPLPVDRPAGAVAGPPVYAERRQELDAPATAAVIGFARHHRLTVSTLLQGAWGLLLARFAGVRDVVFGLTVAGRPAELPGIERMLGLLINTLPVRVPAAAARPLLPWLAELQAELVDMRQHEHSALAAVQGWSEIPRGQELFDSIVIFENYPLDRSLLGRHGELAVGEVRSLERTHYPLTLTVFPGDRLELQLLFDRRRFDAATAGRLLAHLETLLGSMTAGAAAGDRCLSDLVLLTPSQEQQLLREWNDSGAPMRPDACIHERFARVAARRGDATAVEEPAGAGPGRRWSYRELDGHADRLARRLRALGVGPEVLVGVCLERRLEMVAAHLAVLKAGGGCVPLDPAYPAASLAVMIADGPIAVLITERHLLPTLPMPPLPPMPPAHAARLVLIEPEAPAAAAAPPLPAPVTGVDPDNLSHVIYTSGSTGAAKGVVFSHRTLGRFADTAIRLYGLGPADRVLQFCSLSFDAAIEEIYACLLVGATLVLRSDTMPASTAAFLAECAALRITVLDLPTAFWHQLCAGLAAGLAPPAGLRSVIVGGERAAPERLAEWLRHASPATLLTNAYGPAEATIATSAFVPRAGDAMRREVPVGRPIANVQVHLLDDELRLVPPGVPGELCIGGAGVSRGYLRRPDLTAERFVPDASAGEPGARLYRSGDLARHLADGTLELLGRIDDQVKVRGHRVEPGEIESALLQHPAVQQAAVQAWSGAGGGKRLVAYLVIEPGVAPPAAPELRDFLLQRLPPFMVPALFQRLAALPLTAGGSKLDRRALPPPESERPDTGSAYAPPRGEVESCLAEIWSRVLSVDRVGRDDSFFELGGDSILSLQAAARAHQAGLRFTPKQLFECQTVSALAAVVERALPGAAADQGAVTGEMPLTPIQEWFFGLELACPEHWNQAVLLEVKQSAGRPGGDPGNPAGPAGPADPADPAGPAEWRRAIAELMRHHDALRFAFPPPAADRRRQARAAATSEVPFLFCDLRTLPAAARARAIEAAAARSQASLRLGGPLLRAIYFDLGQDGPARLLVAIHHLVVDGVSWRILVEDLATLCRQPRHPRQGAARRLPAKTSSFKQWAEHLAERAGSPELTPEIGHWLALAAARGAALPADFGPADAGPAGAGIEADGAVVRRVLDEDETRALLTEVPPAYGTEINDALLAALLRVLGPWTGSPWLLLDLEGHGREPLSPDLDVSRTVGWFTSVFPVVLELPPEDGPGATLKAVKERLRAVPGRGIGYGLLRYLHPDPEVRRRLADLPRAEVGFNYLGQLDQVLGGDSPFSLAPEPAGPSRDPRAARTHVLEIESRVSGGRLEVEWLYSRRRHRAGTIGRLADAYLDELRALIEHCRSRESRGYTPSDFPQMSFDQSELDRLLDDLAGSLEGAR